MCPLLALPEQVSPGQQTSRQGRAPPHGSGSRDRAGQAAPSTRLMQPPGTRRQGAGLRLPPPLEHALVTQPLTPPSSARIPENGE